MNFTPHDSILTASATFNDLGHLSIALITITLVTGAFTLIALDRLPRLMTITVASVLVGLGITSVLSFSQSDQLKTTEYEKVSQQAQTIYGFPLSSEVVESLLTATREGEEYTATYNELLDGGPAMMREDLGSATFFTPDGGQTTATLAWMGDEWQLVTAPGSTQELPRAATEKDN